MDKDNLVLAQSTENQDSPDEVFLQKQLLYQLDTNGSSDYSRNEVEFNTTSWSNSGKFLNLREGFALIPLVFSVKSNNHDISNGEEDANGDFINGPALNLKLKSDNLNIINSFMCDYNNENVVQANPEIAPYLQFLKNTTSSFDDTKLMAHTGLRDTTQYDWDYNNEYGVIFQDTQFSKIPSPFFVENTQKEKLLGSLSSASGINYNDRSSPREHFYYYNCFIRLKDLPFMDSMVMSRGSNIRMLFTLNQLELTIEHTASGITQNMNKKGSSCPFLLSIEDVVNALPNIGDKMTITCNVAKTTNSQTHAFGQARLYAPAYTLSPEVKKSLEVSPQRHLVYNDIHMNHIRKVPAGKNFNYLVSNAISRLKRLVIVPYLSSNTTGQTNGNGSIGWDSVSSPFTEDGLCHPAPCTIQDFNVSVSGVNVYSTTRKFKFEQYLDELDCSYGVEGGLQDGMRTGLFGLQDYESNQGYIVVDLSRKSEPDETVPVSIEISGVNKGTKDLEFLCYMEIEKDIKIDCITGMKL